MVGPRARPEDPVDEKPPASPPEPPSSADAVPFGIVGQSEQLSDDFKLFWVVKVDGVS